jgi:hypothetical protein
MAVSYENSAMKRAFKDDAFNIDLLGHVLEYRIEWGN